MRAPHRKYTARPKFLTEHLARTARAPCALGNARLPGIETASASPLAVLKLDDSGVYVSTRKGKRVLVVLMCVFFQPSPPLPQFKEKPRLPKRTGLQVGQRETLAVSGLTRTLHWSARFRFTVPNL